MCYKRHTPSKVPAWETDGRQHVSLLQGMMRTPSPKKKPVTPRSTNAPTTSSRLKSNNNSLNNNSAVGHNNNGSGGIGMKSPSRGFQPGFGGHSNNSSEMGSIPRHFHTHGPGAYQQQQQQQRSTVHVSYMMWPSTIQCSNLLLHSNPVDGEVVARKVDEPDSTPKVYKVDEVYSATATITDVTNAYVPGFVRNSFNAMSSCFITFGFHRCDETLTLEDDGVFQNTLCSLLNLGAEMRLGTAIKIRVSAGTMGADGQMVDVLQHPVVRVDREGGKLSSTILQDDVDVTSIRSRIQAALKGGLREVANLIILIDTEIRGAIGRIALVDVNAANTHDALQLGNVLCSLAQRSQDNTVHVPYRMSSIAQQIQTYCGDIAVLIPLAESTTGADARTLLELGSRIFFSKHESGCPVQRDYQSIALRLQSKLEALSVGPREEMHLLTQEVKSLKTENYLLRTTLASKLGGAYMDTMSMEGQRIVSEESATQHVARGVVNTLVSHAVVAPCPAYLGDVTQLVSTCIQLLHQTAEREKVIEGYQRTLLVNGIDRGDTGVSEPPTFQWQVWHRVIKDIRSVLSEAQDKESIQRTSRSHTNLFDDADDPVRMMQQWLGNNRDGAHTELSSHASEVPTPPTRLVQLSEFGKYV